MTHHPEIRPSTKADVEQFYGPFPWTFQAFSMVKDEEVMAVAGMFYGGEDYMVAFSDAKAEVYQSYRIAAARMAVMTRRLIAGKPVIAVSNDGIPGSAEFLERLGFEQVNERVYRWRLG
jgi:FMN phosphatase YigB (HAD superfamily)